MRGSIKSAIKETYKDMIDVGLTTSLTEIDIEYLGMNVTIVNENLEEINDIRKNNKLNNGNKGK